MHLIVMRMLWFSVYQRRNINEFKMSEVSNKIILQWVLQSVIFPSVVNQYSHYPEKEITFQYDF